MSEQPRTFFQHPTALVESEQIGPGTQVQAFAHILPGATVGADSTVCDHVFIENDVCVGNRVTIKCGAQLCAGLTLEDDVFIGPNAVFVNDPGAERPQHTVVRAGASIGAHATILAGLTVGRRAMVGAGVVLTHDVPPNAVVTGNPARIVGYVDAARGQSPPPPPNAPPHASRVKGVTVHELPIIIDMRGNLSVGELGQGLPFAPQRYFTVFDVPSREVRGEHAHRTLHQFFVCLKGDCALVLDDGVQREELRLETPAVGVHVAPLVWGVQYKFSPDAILLVLASDKYNPHDYIRDYDEFVRLIGAP